MRDGIGAIVIKLNQTKKRVGELLLENRKLKLEIAEAKRELTIAYVLLEAISESEYFSKKALKEFLKEKGTV